MDLFGKARLVDELRLRIEPDVEPALGDAFGVAALARVAARRGTVQGGSTSAEVNRILDKISANGLHSLTEAEKRILREASRKSQ
jgi:hypothetical protein